MGEPQRWREERREHAERKRAFEAGRLAGLSEAAGAFKAEAIRLRPHYQSQTATDAGRRQMLDHFEMHAATIAKP